MKKVILILLLVFSALISEKTKANNGEVNESTSSSNEVNLPNDYFSPLSSNSGENYQEESTTEGPDGPPAPIDDWIPIFFILGVAIVAKQLHNKKRI